MLRYTEALLMALLLLCLASCHKGDITLLVREVNSHTAYELSDIAFTDDSTGYICGGIKYNLGILIKTTDGGKTWAASDSQAAAAFNTMAFFSAQEAFFGNYFGQLGYTNDSARTISARQLSDGLPLMRLSFRDRQRGVAVCGLAYRSGSVYNTTDGGNNWTKTYNDSLHSLMGSAYIDDSTVIICGFGTILRSVNGGASFKVVRENGDFYQALKFVNSTTGYAVGYQGEVIKTTNRGISWQIVSPSNGFFSSPNYLLGVDFTDENNGYAVGESGYMIHTSNGGRDWQTVKQFTGSRLRTVHMFSATSGLVAGGDGKVYLFQQ